MESVICTHCGQENMADARFCRFCGQALSGSGGGSHPQQTQIAITIPTEFFTHEALATLFGWYLAVNALLWLISSQLLLFGGIAAVLLSGRLELASGYGIFAQASEYGIFVQLIGVALFLFSLMEATAARGLLAHRAWAANWGRAALGLNAGVFLIGLIVGGASTVIVAITAVAMAAGGIACLRTPKMQSYFRESQTQ